MSNKQFELTNARFVNTRTGEEIDVPKTAVIPSMDSLSVGDTFVMPSFEVSGVVEDEPGTALFQTIAPQRMGLKLTAHDGKPVLLPVGVIVKIGDYLLRVTAHDGDSMDCVVI